MRSSEGRASATLRHPRTRRSSRGPRIRRVARARRLELRAPDGRWLIETCSRSRRTSADPRPPNLSIPAATVRLAQLNPRRIAIPTRPPVSAFLAVSPAPRARSPARTWSTTAYSFVAWPIHPPRRHIQPSTVSIDSIDERGVTFRTKDGNAITVAGREMLGFLAPSGSANAAPVDRGNERFSKHSGGRRDDTEDGNHERGASKP